MRMTARCVAGLLVLGMAACGDRRADPEVDPASTGSSSPPGERVLTTPEAAAEPDQAGAQPSMPAASGAPAPGCEGGDGNCPGRDADTSTSPPPATEPPRN